MAVVDAGLVRVGGRLQDAVFQNAVRLLLLASAVFLLAPLLVVVLLSFDARPYLGSFPPTSFSIQWYKRFFETDLYVSGLWTSIEVSCCAVFVSVSVGVAAAVALSRLRFPGRDALISVFMAPLIVPTVVIGSSLVLFLGFADIHNGFARLFLGHVLITMPYSVRTTLAALSGIPSNFEEAAQSLGASDWSVFWSVTFPLAKRGVIAGAIFGFAMSLDDVSVSLFLVEPPYYTLPVALLTQMRANFDLTIAAIGTMLTASTAALIFLLDRLIGLDQLFGRGVYHDD